VSGAPGLVGFFIYYHRGSEILWGKTLMANALLWGGVLLVTFLFRAAKRSSSSTTPTPSAPPGDGPAGGAGLRSSLRAPTPSPAPDLPERTIVPVEGKEPPGEAPRLRMSMGRPGSPGAGPARPGAPSPGAPAGRGWAAGPTGAVPATRGPATSCPDCATVLSPTDGACPACGRPR
jgi:hypothetical protein